MKRTRIDAEVIEHITATLDDITVQYALAWHDKDDTSRVEIVP